MTLNLDKLVRMNDFALMTEAFGEIRCTTLNLKDLSAVGKMANIPDINGFEFSRKVLGMVSTKRADTEGRGGTEAKGVALTDNEIRLISDEEVETFAKEFVAHNGWLLRSGENRRRQATMREKSGRDDIFSQKTINPEKGNAETSSDYLVRVLVRYLDEQSQHVKEMMEPLSGWLAANPFGEQMKKMTESLSSRMATSMFKDSTLESLRANVSLSDQLQDTIKAFDQSKLNAGITNATFERTPIYMRDIRIPENPVLETNRQISGVLEHIENIGPIVVQSAELIGNMNDTALRMQADFMRNAHSTHKYAWIAIVIAVVSLMASSFFSWLSYDDAKQVAARNDIQLKLFQQETRSLIAAQEKDRAALVSVLNNLLQHQQSKPKK